MERFGDSFLVEPASEFTIPRVTYLIYVLSSSLGETFKVGVLFAETISICDRNISDVRQLFKPWP